MFDINKFYIDDEDHRKAIVNIKLAWNSLADYHEVEQILAITTLAIKSAACEMKNLDEADRKLCNEKIREILEIELPETVKDGKETAKTPKEKLKRFREHKAAIALCKALGTSVPETPIQFTYDTEL